MRLSTKTLDVVVRALDLAYESDDISQQERDEAHRELRALWVASVRDEEEAVADNLARLEGMSVGESLTIDGLSWRLDDYGDLCGPVGSTGGLYDKFSRLHALPLLRAAIKGGATIQAAADPSDVGGTA